MASSFCEPHALKNLFAVLPFTRRLPFANWVLLRDTVIYPQLQLPDPLADNAGILIKALQGRTTWGAEQKGLLEQLIEMLGRKRYITFVGHPTRYYLTPVSYTHLTLPTILRV